MSWQSIIDLALREDIGEGDHSTLASIPKQVLGEAKIVAKESGIIAGVDVVRDVFLTLDASLQIQFHALDGAKVHPRDQVASITGSLASIVTAERTALNIFQRMCGIASATAHLVQLIQGTQAILLDTRKTTPGMRLLEKMAVKVGGAQNHRFGLYDMIMLKDNHIDAAGGIQQAIASVKAYLKEKGMALKVEVEARSIADVQEILRCGGVDRILLDNFTVQQTLEAVKLVNGTLALESSGMINKETIRAYAETGVQFISVGALTHSVKSLDLSLVITHG